MKFQGLVEEIFPIKEIKSISEKISEYTISFSTTINGLKIENLADLFGKFDSKDKVTLSIKIYETIIIDSESYDFTIFIETVKKELSTVEDEEIVISFTIIKSSFDGIINIYDFEEFNKFFMERKTLDILNLLSPLLLLYKSISFKILYNIVDDFYSDCLFFIKSSSTDIDTNKRDVDIDKARVNCHFENFSNYPFTAKYFDLKKRPIVANEISKKLDRLTFLFYIIGLYDITSIKNNSFYSKINGYKSFEIDSDIEAIDISSSSEYAKIYDWIYSEKSHVTDKIGLFRNILSIHLKEGSYNINENVYISVNSGYKSYLQSSINKYIDVRNKVTDQVNLISQKSNDLAEKYLSNYQKSNFAFISFFISVFLLRVLNTKSIDTAQGVFNKDTTIIFFALIGISLLYFIFSLITFNMDVTRLDEKYQLLKNRNEDLLDKKDIEKILNNDTEFNSDLEYLKMRKISYTILWVVTLIIFICAVLSLSNYINWNSIFQMHSH